MRRFGVNCVANNGGSGSGGAVCSDVTSDLKVSYAIFGDPEDASKANWASTNGGAIWTRSTGKVELDHVEVYGRGNNTNAAQNGSAVFSNNTGTVTITDCVFENLRASASGGVYAAAECERESLLKLLRGEQRRRHFREWRCQAGEYQF